MGLSISVTGSFDQTDRFLTALARGDVYRILGAYAQQGVDALSAATPEDTGQTAASWSASVEVTTTGATIWWSNSHVDEVGTPIAVMLQFGHGTGTGGYVQGRNYINPAMRPVFDRIAQDVWREVMSL